MINLLNLSAGDNILFSGIIYTARDQAHKRLAQDIGKGKKLPFDIFGSVIYYCGPTRACRGKVIGSCGPTTSSRMDEFTPLLLKKGLKAMIGKGRRSREVVAAIKKHKAVYLLAPAGCGALVSKCVKQAKPVAYPDLGPEQILRLEVENLPLIVAIDRMGRSIYG
ncbi:MAG: FumA C-terminus/TtdB family hydratase beta subunit [Candidatus Omnitrophica bacterium]|nr:FumA C-terminus/TtdB family hydratase beta subunit [Candidatus Omnitrophota bacterium]MDD4982186.1 FumA C-terminus/TtdB family hydratase beta subunit [Candidatus Omnitrophota bacterium]MDD5665582.1 FumA C-terminus/TtdB family hydratase beta subunit [Candidatus Omnitrophota bacterium]